MERYITRIVDMPVGVKACVNQDAEGDYNIYVNAHYNKEQQERAVLHEIGHIITDDFHNIKSIEEVEA